MKFRGARAQGLEGSCWTHPAVPGRLIRVTAVERALTPGEHVLTVDTPVYGFVNQDLRDWLHAATLITIVDVPARHRTLEEQRAIEDAPAPWGWGHWR